MKTKLFFLSLCALTMCLVACGPKAPELSMNEIITGIDGGEYKVEITSETTWTARPSKDWVTIDLDTWPGTAIVKIKVPKGINGDPAKVTFTNEGGTAEVIIRRETVSNGGFSVAAGKQVKFAPGNLQYQASTNTWRFAEHQYDIIGEDNCRISDTYAGWIDLFGWNTAEQPWNPSLYFFEMAQSVNGYPVFVDWGTNVIDSDSTKSWRTLRLEEWMYLFEKRPYASLLYGAATVEEQEGIIVLPDNALLSIVFEPGMNNFMQNDYSADEWLYCFEEIGALFLPYTESRQNRQMFNITTYYGHYVFCWTSTIPVQKGVAYPLSFRETGVYVRPQDICTGLPVRLAKDL